MDLDRRPDWPRCIGHLDVDAFYASVELLRRPQLRGKPVVVAGAGPRAVVTTASYEARRFGIDSAMPAARARALCPHAVFLPPDFTTYRATSSELWELVRARVARVQQVGIDEGYVDLTQEEKPLRLLRDIVAEVHATTGMTMSVGLGPSRLVAKTSSAAFKPGAFVALSREDACRRFAGSPTRILQGIGPKTAERLGSVGLVTIGDLQRAEAETLVERFGRRLGGYLKARASFEDESPVETARVVKSRSCEATFPQDVAERAALEDALCRLAEDLCVQLRRRAVRGRTVAIKVRLDDWTTVTRARTIAAVTNDPATVSSIALELLRAYAPARPVRLLGVRVASLDEMDPAGPNGREQLALPL